MFPGRQDLNFWCRFMCIQSINWPPQFSEVIRGKHQKPITVSRTLNQTDMSLKRCGHEKLTGGFLRRLKMWSIFFLFHLSQLVWSTFFHTVTGFGLSLNTNNLDDRASSNGNSNKVNLKTPYFRHDIEVISFLFTVRQLNITPCLVLLFHRGKSKEVSLTWFYWLRSKWSPWLPVMRPLNSPSLRGWFCDPWVETLKILWAQSVSAVSWVQENWERIKSSPDRVRVTLNP